MKVELLLLTETAEAQDVLDQVMPFASGTEVVVFHSPRSQYGDRQIWKIADERRWKIPTLLFINAETRKGDYRETVYQLSGADITTDKIADIIIYLRDVVEVAPGEYVKGGKEVQKNADGFFPIGTQTFGFKLPWWAYIAAFFLILNTLEDEK